MSITSFGIEAVERGWVPDLLTRVAIRRLCRQRLREVQRPGNDHRQRDEAFAQSQRKAPIALVPDRANEQHYELPPEFFAQVLGPHRKYSCCYWQDPHTTLEAAEATALRITCERAELNNGMRILELGCGWGSLSLFMAEQYPDSTIIAVSNSAPQRRYIESLAKTRGLRNLHVVTADMNTFDPSASSSDFANSSGNLGPFDRVVSVEMFEHMRNYEQLLARIASWLRPDGKLFVHVFCHRSTAYVFDEEGDSNWMGRYFFSGGIMPSANLLSCFTSHLTVAKHWSWNGSHYQRTAEAWLANLDANRLEVMSIFRATYGGKDSWRWLQRWRMFFLAVAELFAYSSGNEWHVGHYLLQRSSERSLRVSTHPSQSSMTPCGDNY